MGDERIRVLIADDHDATIQTLETVLRLERDIDVVGGASDGVEAIEKARALRPDVVLMDINMPRLDGIAATETITAQLPEVAVVMLSAQADSDHLRRSMNVGASYFLAKPISSDELADAIRRAHGVARARNRGPAAPRAEQPRREKHGSVIAVFSPSGGVGRTTIAVNLAIALRRATAKRVALADLSLPFGDVGVLLNVPPTAPSIAELVGKFAEAEAEDLEDILFEHRSGVKVLLAPPTPEAEELISAADVTRMLGLLAEGFGFVVVDTWPSYGEAMLAVLDAADAILVPLTPELTTMKNARVFLDLAAKLDLESKVRLILNRRDSGLKHAEVEGGLGRKVEHDLSTEEVALRVAMNRGVPILDSHAASRLSKEFVAMAQTLCTGTPVPARR